ncbi:beta strand repeat-containing protein [Methylosinus sp. LW4]|uniref:beta strand repeat-containing protein n=1 Tax=Methylosinus sp. LW4 TaxID=136993 RepID=UPI001FD9F05F|nr:filamentous hemagglutinin N-terminal domain-containing protein [Methylosinus sp. LW4]
MRPNIEARLRNSVSRPSRRPLLRAVFSATTAIAAVLALPSFALANPTGGVVVDGAATISSTTNVTNVVQSTNRAIINWQSFSIGLGQTVNFLQPSSLAVTLNRVIGNEQSIIAGALNANGKVFIINSNGIMFTKDAQVNVGGLVASTLDISNSNFMAGNYTFSGSSAASVVNKGTINAADGGYVALLGKTVSNEGTINAKLGTIALASGDAITLNFSGDSLLDVTIDKGTYDALVENKGLIQADGGNVVLTAKAADAVLSAQVNNSGVIQARTLADLTGGSSSTGSVKIGKIKLLASGGTTKVSGTLDASAPNGGKGGTIETSGDKVTIADSAVVTTASSTGDTGTWIIDPDGFTIGTNGDITGTLLGSLLASNNIALWSTSGSGADGNINVNSAVSWSGNTILTLNATNNININASITATGASAGLVLNYGNYASAGSATSGTKYSIASGASVTLSGASASLNINGKSYTLIHDASGLAAVSGSGSYALAQDLDLSGKTYSTAVISSLTGTLAGLGHVINNLTIKDTSGGGFDGLIGVLGSSSITTATVRDLGLTNVNISGAGPIGGLAGRSYGSISNVYVTGTVSGDNNVGGVVGINQRGSITNSYFSGSVYGTGTSIGGLAGNNFGTTATISNSYAIGTVTATGVSLSSIGGLTGSNGGAITNSYANEVVTVTPTANAIGTITPANYIGGLVGSNTGSVSTSSAAGTLNVTSANYVGGLIGWNNAGTVKDVTSSTNVNVTWATSDNGSGYGGLIGYNTGTVTGGLTSGNVTVTLDNGFSSYGVSSVGGGIGLNAGNVTSLQSTGDVTAPSSSWVGGLIGFNRSGTVANSSATGSVVQRSGPSDLIGNNQGKIVNSTYRDAKAEARAAAQAAAQLAQTRQSAFAAGNVTSSAAVESSAKQTKLAASTAAGKNAVASAAAPSISDSMQGEEPATTSAPAARARPRHVAAATPAASHKPAARGAGYGARIRSIDVDGQHFDLGTDGKNSAPAPKAQ